MKLSIRLMTQSDLGPLPKHLERHLAEARQGEPYFMPYAPDDPGGPTVPDSEVLDRAVTSCCWERWFAAFANEDCIVGNVRLKGRGLKTDLSPDFAREFENLINLDLSVEPLIEPDTN